jgi:5'(3')-deoxyribonucleotidase
MKTIFVDMDGVLSDFEKRYRELFNTDPGETRDKKFPEHWRTIVDNGHFETLELMPGAQTLLEYLQTLTSVQKVILSSTGGFEDHKEISFQKKQWLLQNKFLSMWTTIIFVPGKEYKKGYASSNSLLIDDTLSIIIDFQKAGGSAIHYKEPDPEYAIKFIKKWLHD